MARQAEEIPAEANRSHTAGEPMEIDAGTAAVVEIDERNARAVSSEVNEAVGDTVTADANLTKVDTYSVCVKLLDRLCCQ